MKKKLRYQCYKCDERFKSWQERNHHCEQEHKPVLEPKKTIEVIPGYEEVRNLIDGKDLKLGDVIWLGRKTVITKIERTENSRDILATLKITRGWYSREEIN